MIKYALTRDHLIENAKDLPLSRIGIEHISVRSLTVSEIHMADRITLYDGIQSKVLKERK